LSPFSAIFPGEGEKNTEKTKKFFRGKIEETENFFAPFFRYFLHRKFLNFCCFPAGKAEKKEKIIPNLFSKGD